SRGRAVDRSVLAYRERDLERGVRSAGSQGSGGEGGDVLHTYAQSSACDRTISYGASGVGAAIQREAMGAARIADQTAHQAAANRNRQFEEPDHQPGCRVVYRPSQDDGKSLFAPAQLNR